MKKKFGFTLAEVLITLAIIGIIAALVLPALMNNFQFRAVGVRLSKFMSTVENTTRAYVETEGSLDPSQGANPTADNSNLNNYLRNCFSITGITDNNYSDHGRIDIHGRAAVNAREFGTNIVSADGRTPGSAPIVLKDGTRMNVFPLRINVDDGDVFPAGSPVPDTGTIGRPALGIVFDPSANALPSTVRRTFGFVVTELGYVFPAPTDACTWSLFINRWQTRPENFAVGTACANAESQGAFNATGMPDGWSDAARGDNP